MKNKALNPKLSQKSPMSKNYDRDYVDEKFDNLAQDIKELKEAVRLIQVEFTRLIEFIPVRNVVFGLVGLMLTAVVVALLGAVLRQ